MITREMIEKEVRKTKEFEFSIIKESQIKEYFEQFDYKNYINEKKQSFESLIDALTNFYSVQDKLHIAIKNRVEKYNAYDSEQMINNMNLSKWNNFMQATKENCLLYYRDYYDELNISERDRYSHLWHEINNLLYKINKKQKEIDDYVRPLKIINLYADDLSRKIITFFNKKIFDGLRKNNFILLSKEDESSFSKEEAVKNRNMVLMVLTELKNFNVPSNDAVDKEGSLLMLKSVQFYKEVSEYLLLKKRPELEITLSKKEKKRLKKFEKRYKTAN